MMGDFKMISRRILFIGMLVLYLAPLALADSSSTLMPSFSAGWAGIPAGLQTQIKWAISIVFALVVAVIAIYIVMHSGHAVITSSAATRSASIGNIIFGVVVFFVMMAALLLLFSLVG
jgi:hypothetical protein